MLDKIKVKLAIAALLALMLTVIMIAGSVK